MGQRGQWMSEINQLSRRLATPDLSPEQHAVIKAEMNKLQANPPVAQAAGLAGQDRPMMTASQALARKNLLRRGER